MEEPVPILSPEQIESLSSMVRSIQAENRRDFQEVLSERCDLQHTTIINLYHYAAEEWTSKQKVLENLCHFTLTIMNTLSFLWERKQHQQSELDNAQKLILSLQYQISDLNEQIQRIQSENEQLRDSLQEARNQLRSIDLFCNKNDQKDYNLQSTPNLFHTQCSGCLQIDSQLDRVKSQLHLLSSKAIEERELEIETLREQHQRLEEQYQQLQEEHKLTKLEVELAELAVQEALAYKNSYLQMVSQTSKLELQGINSIWQQKVRDEELQPQLFKPHASSQKTGHDAQDEYPLNSHVLGCEVPEYYSQNYSQDHQFLGLPESSKMQEALFGDESQIKMAQQKKTSHESPYLRNQHPQQEVGGGPGCSFAQSSINCPTYSAIILQSSLDLTLSQKSQKSSSKEIMLNPIYSSNVIQLVKRQKRDSRPNELPKGGMRKCKEGRNYYWGYSRDSMRESSTIGRLYNLLSTKLVSNRIRTK